MRAANVTTATDDDHDKAPQGQTDVSELMKGFVTFLIKGASRLIWLNEVQVAPENKRPAIMETILEMAFTEELIGGIAQKPDIACGTDVRDRVDEARRYAPCAVKSCREEADLTQTELARLAGIPQSHVSRIERGRHVPTRLTIKRLAKALNVGPVQLDPGYREAH